MSTAGILYDIVNTQNLQIQAMYDYLDAKRLPETDNCDVYVETIPQEIALQSSVSGAVAAQLATGVVMGLGALATVMSMI